MNITALCSLLLAASLLPPPSPLLPPVGRLKYFTADALATADLEGVKELIDGIVARCDGECAAAEKLAATLVGRERDEVLARVEITRRLKDYILLRHRPEEKDMEVMAWQGAEEMRCLLEYFSEVAKYSKLKAGLPAAVTLNVRDYGAKGDGVSDDGPAMRAAIEAAKAKNAPVTIVIPAGTYVIRPDAAEHPDNVEFGVRRHIDWPDYAKTPRKWADLPGKCHLAVIGADELTIEGQGEVELRFADATRGGVAFFGCRGSVLRNVAISYLEKPFSQGTIIRVDDEPTGFVLRKDEGYPDPDGKRFLKADSNRFTAHQKNGLVAMDGTGRVGSVERQPDGTFLFRPPGFEGDHSYWKRRTVGERIVVVARYHGDSMAFPVSFHFSGFCGAQGVRVYESPGQPFIDDKSYASHLQDCTVDIRPGSKDMLASNADGCIAGGVMSPKGCVGPYICGCRFVHMEDDAFNICTFAGRISAMREDRRWITGPWFDGAFAMQIDPQSGVVKAVLRPSKTERHMFTTEMPADTVTQNMLGKHDDKEFVRTGAWSGKKRRTLPDHVIFVPGIVGAVMRNSRVGDLRGMGGQVHCSNMLIENYKVAHVQGPALSVNPLFGWGMMFDVHNVIIRNCLFREMPIGVRVKPAQVSVGVEPQQLMIQGVSVDNCVFDLIPRAGELSEREIERGNCWDIRRDGVDIAPLP